MNLAYIQSINESYRKKKMNFGNLYIQNNLVIVSRKYNYLEMILITVV